MLAHIKEWFLSMLAFLGFVRKRINAMDETPHVADWNPFIAAAVERERQAMIRNKLRQFFQSKPRPWLSPNARATKLREQRHNAQREMEKRLHSKRGLQ